VRRRNFIPDLAIGFVLLAVLAFFALSGCTRTNVYRGGEMESSSWSLGPAPQPRVDGETVLVRQRGLGVLAGRSGAGVGYFASDTTYVAKSCIVVLRVRTLEQVRRIAAEYGPLGLVCATTGG